MLNNKGSFMYHFHRSELCWKYFEQVQRCQDAYEIDVLTESDIPDPKLLRCSVSRFGNLMRWKEKERRELRKMPPSEKRLGFGNEKKEWFKMKSFDLAIKSALNLGSTNPLFSFFFWQSFRSFLSFYINQTFKTKVSTLLFALEVELSVMLVLEIKRVHHFKMLKYS